MLTNEMEKGVNLAVFPARSENHITPWTSGGHSSIFIGDLKEPPVTREMFHGRDSI